MHLFDTIEKYAQIIENDLHVWDKNINFAFNE